jgi:hypothetical protein
VKRRLTDASLGWRLLRVTAAFLALSGAGEAAAQGPPGGGGPPLAAQGQQGLSFGNLLVGVPEPVLPADPARSAQFRVRQGNRTVQVSFVLPGALEGPGGTQVPLSFGPMDAVYSATQNAAGGVPFDPTTPWILPAGGGGWNWIFLGGTALAPPSAAQGAYQASILIVLTDLGS